MASARLRRVRAFLDAQIQKRAKLPLTKRVLYVVCSLPVSIVTYIYGADWAFMSLVVAYGLLIVGLLHERATHLGSATELMNKLGQFAEKADQNDRYGYYKVVYEVDRGDNDPWFRLFVIIPGPGNSVAHVSRFFVGAKQDVGRETWHFEDLGVEASMPGGDIEVVPSGYDRTGGGWRCTLLLEKPVVAGELPREINVHGHWPALWDRLRSSEEDDGAFLLDKPAELLEISVILPEQWKGRTLRMPIVDQPEASRGGSAEPVLGSTRQGHPQLTWRVTRAAPGTYRYKVQAIK